MNLAPIVLFVYNRPEETLKTLEALRSNELADESDLFIFCDGPKESMKTDQYCKLNKVRELIRTQNWCKNVHIIEQNKNLGLGTSIINGVTEVINQYGKAIVMEDDLVTSPFFLQYMNQCLEHYEARKSVFSVSALSRPFSDRFFPKDYDYDVYVSQTHRPWGWATWKDRWNQVDWSAEAYHIIKKNPSMIKAFNRLGADYFDALDYQQTNNQNVWSIRFALSHFVNHAVSICPIVSYVSNIGWGDEATNTVGTGETWKMEKLSFSRNIRFLDVLYEDARIINAWYSFSISKKRSIYGRIRNRLAAKFKHRDEYVLKGKVYE